jgi:DNA replication initiation complex subunit (GINS family)
MTVTDEARDLIANRLTAIEDERRRLERAVAAMSESRPVGRPRKSATGRGRPSNNAKGKPTGVHALKTKRKIAKRGQRPAEVLAVIEAYSGRVTPKQVGEAVGISASQASGIVAQLRKDGKVKPGLPLQTA